MVTFRIDGLPELNARLDKIAKAVSGPIAREALQAGGKIIKDRAVENVHRLTGALAGDVIVVTRMREEGLEKYVLIGAGWDPSSFRRVANRQAANRQIVRADQTTNPGIYGLFLEVGHAPGQGMARKPGKKVESGRSTPAYPWLGPAFESERDAALQAAADVIETRLAEQGF